MFDQCLDFACIDGCSTVECGQHFDGGVELIYHLAAAFVAGDGRRSATHQ